MFICMAFVQQGFIFGVPRRRLLQQVAPTVDAGRKTTVLLLLCLCAR